MPNFLDLNNTGRVYLRGLREIGGKYDVMLLHGHFEHLAYNECYLDNIDKYEYIAVHDQDEIIVPRFLNSSIVWEARTRIYNQPVVDGGGSGDASAAAAAAASSSEPTAEDVAKRKQLVFENDGECATRFASSNKTIAGEYIANLKQRLSLTQDMNMHFLFGVYLQFET